MSRILIADDVEENRYLLQMLLTGHGHEVVVACNGAEALEKSRSENPDLILTDVLMPLMDGFELCRQCKQDDALAAIPFVFYTATYTDPKDRAFGLSLGAERYLVKPLEPDFLMELVQEILDRDSGPRTAPPEDLADESSYLKEHNEALIRKLEAKMTQLEKANELLRREVEERRQAETRLRRLYAAIENAAECFIISDASGNVEYVNPAFEKTAGFSREEMVGTAPAVESEIGSKEHFLQSLWNVYRKGNPCRGQLDYRRGDGERVEFETVVSPIIEPSAEVSGYVTVLRDITEHRKLEERLRQAQKMEAIGTLAGGIAHDFNNILSIILGYVDLLASEATEGSESERTLRQVLTACDRARTLVRQILTFSRKAERLLVPTDLTVLLQEDVKLLRAALPATIEIETRVKPKTGARILGDPVQIHQLILNLATNAAHAMGEKGGLLELTLEEAEITHDGAQQHPDLSPGKYWLLAVGDTGSGMDQSILTRIFEPFFTTKAPGEGTGLGLSVAHGIVQGHGGAINVYSELGSGSTFKIYLPAVASECNPEEEGDTTPLPGGSERILFVDDEVYVAEIGERMLKRFGYQVTTSVEAPAALKLFQANPYAFDLVITDQTMPHMTGADLAMEMLKIRPELPVLLCSGFSIGVAEEKAVANGIKKVMMKPLTMRNLIRTVRSVLDER